MNYWFHASFASCSFPFPRRGLSQIVDILGFSVSFSWAVNWYTQWSIIARGFWSKSHAKSSSVAAILKISLSVFQGMELSFLWYLFCQNELSSTNVVPYHGPPPPGSDCQEPKMAGMAKWVLCMGAGLWVRWSFSSGVSTKEGEENKFFMRLSPFIACQCLSASVDDDIFKITIILSSEERILFLCSLLVGYLLMTREVCSQGVYKEIREALNCSRGQFMAMLSGEYLLYWFSRA